MSPNSISALVYESGQAHFPLSATGSWPCEYSHLTGVRNPSIQTLLYRGCLTDPLNTIGSSICFLELSSILWLFQQYAILPPDHFHAFSFQAEEIIVLSAPFPSNGTWTNPLPTYLFWIFLPLYI